MNGTIGCNYFGSWSYLGPNNDNLKTNDNGTRLLSLSEECRLFIMNSYYHSKKYIAIHGTRQQALLNELTTFLLNGT